MRCPRFVYLTTIYVSFASQQVTPHAQLCHDGPPLVQNLCTYGLTLIAPKMSLVPYRLDELSDHLLGVRCCHLFLRAERPA
jgi:hypothetical protein